MADHGHDHVALSNAAFQHCPREAEAPREQVAEVVDPSLALGIDRDHGLLREGELLYDVFDEVHESPT
jgi:hypothetical protein